MKPETRLFIYTADLIRISGKCERTCRRLMSKIRAHFGIEKGQEITVHHASKFFNIPAEQLFPYIKTFSRCN